MLTYSMDARGNTPLYEYLYRCIRDDILSGVLAAGEKLPSKRALADHLHLPALRQAIAQDLRDYKGMAVSAEQVVVGAGAEYLYLLLAQLLGPDTVLAVEDPGYPKIRLVYGKCGARCRPVPLDSQGLDMGALAASGATAVHLSPSHHYPTGLVTPIGRRQELLRWASDTGGIIIEDDYDSEFRLSGHAGGVHGTASPSAGTLPPGAGLLRLHRPGPGSARAGPLSCRRPL